jgi:hypothetical protein
MKRSKKKRNQTRRVARESKIRLRKMRKARPKLQVMGYYMCKEVVSLEGGRSSLVFISAIVVGI